MTWEYNVRDHTFTHNGSNRLPANYAGAGGYKDDPTKECIINKGPLPHGNYTIGAPYNSPHTGKYTLSLTPKSSSDMCGRDAFKIHGMNSKHPDDSSNGCIIAPLSVRKAIYNSGDTELIVR
ncbi:tlde1 domain-containing protein [Erwinia sp. Eh17-17]|uniref:tlde1 domain-containing protein n=1 Tax=Erwinia sp. Eh17-17 TaxID=3080330 RepID=UPI003208DD7B